MKKLKLSNKNKLLIAVATLLLVSAIFSIYFATKKTEGKLEDFVNDSQLIDGGQEKPVDKSDDEKVQVDIVSAITFDLEELSFRFAIVKIRVQTEDENINVSLDKFKTSE